MNKEGRLSSLDILRGFDLWLLLMVGPVATAFVEASGGGAFADFVRLQTEHVEWHGFVLWDIIMPLFLFMSGVTIPFSMAKYRNGTVGWPLYKRLIKRFALLFLLGWIVQGNLLDLDFKEFHPYANTLQTIAVGYVVSAILFVNFRPRTQIAFCASFFLAYLLVFVFAGHMNLDPQGNVAMLIDKAVLGSHRDGVLWAADGSWSYMYEYQYTWILSSLNFIVTVMLGCFAGQIIRSRGCKGSTALVLLATGLLLVGAGLAMDPFFPIVKKIWSSSMTLFSGGICYLMLCLTFYVVDVRKHSRAVEWLKYYGMNSIVAYCIGEVIVFSSVSASLLHGFEHILGAWYPVLIALANTFILFFILRFMYKRNVFLKV